LDSDVYVCGKCGFQNASLTLFPIRTVATIQKKKKIEVNDHVRILAYPEDGINGYGRIQMIDRRSKKPYWVVNGNMPFQGDVSDFFSEKEIRKA